MGALKGNRVLDRTRIRIPKSFGRVAVLANVAEVRLAGRLVARGAVRRQLLARDVAVGTGQRGVSALESQWVFEITGIGPREALRCVAVLTLGAKVRDWDRLVAVAALRSGSLYSLVAILAP